VKPSQIKVPEVRVTAQFTEEDREIFRKTIQEWGIETPILCFEIDGQLVLVDGLNRLEEAVRAGAQTVDVAVRPGDMIQVYTRNIFLDHTRGKHRVSDMIKVLKHLYEDLGQGVEQIQEATHLTRDYIERLLKISRANPEVLAALDAGSIGVGIAGEIVRLPHPIQQEELLAKSTHYRLRAADVREFVDQVLEDMGKLPATPPGQPAQQPARIVEYHCEGCKEIVDPRYLRPVMVCPECFGEIWRLQKAKEATRVEVEDNGEGD